MQRACDKIAVIVNALDGTVHNKNILAFLQELKEIALSLEYGQRSEKFHNKLRSFNRMWGDEFSPQATMVRPLIDDLFAMHGFPEEKAKPK